MNKSIFAFLLTVMASFATSAADSPKDVQALIGRGDYAGAETALRRAIAEHPNSAKAHYVLAEVLAHEGNIGEAKAEAARAGSLDPATRFTDPAKFQRFQRELDEALAPASAKRSSLSSLAPSVDTRRADGRAGDGQGSSHGLGLIVLLLAIGLIAFLWMRRRRQARRPFSEYPPAPAAGGVPPYGGYPGYAPPPSSGVGTAVAAGLGGLAAGALLDEAFRSHRDGESMRDPGSAADASPSASSQAYDDLRNEPIDMGNDDSSWGGDGSDAGDVDDNQW